jgi:hypothetical protein|tara:strand:+ start:1165 stop:1554 length:390 start_codon:yes stop_codon:yes gene_type:complete
MLILIGMMSLNSFSQNVIDSTSIRLQKPIVRLVIKDLITGDSFKKELSLITTKYSFLENKVVLKDSVINNLNFQINNFNSILSTKGSQLEFTKQLNDKLRLEIKKQRLKNKILGGAGLVAIGGVILILK